LEVSKEVRELWEDEEKESETGTLKGSHETGKPVQSSSEEIKAWEFEHLKYREQNKETEKKERKELDSNLLYIPLYNRPDREKKYKLKNRIRKHKEKLRKLNQK